MQFNGAYATIMIMTNGGHHFTERGFCFRIIICSVEVYCGFVVLQIHKPPPTSPAQQTYICNCRQSLSPSNAMPSSKHTRNRMRLNASRWDTETRTAFVAL